MKSKNKKILILLLLAIVSIGILAPHHGANASGLTSIVNVTAGAINSFLLSILQALTSMIGIFIAIFAKILSAFINFVDGPPQEIYDTWEIMRNFVNLFFILFLVIMAFGTIFNIHDYTYRDMLVPLIIGALFVNFSFVIGEWILIFANRLSSVFLEITGDVSLLFSQGMSLGKLVIGGKEIANSTVGVMPIIVSALFFLIFLVVAAGAMLIITIFVIIRIPIMWFLLIVAPVAFLGYSMPSIRAKTWSRWWGAIIKWSFFVPIYLAFLMFSTIFISAKKGIGELNLQAGSTPGILDSLTQTFGINEIFFYVITLIFMIGGLKVAFSIGDSMGEGIGAAASWVKNAVLGAASHAPIVPGFKGMPGGSGWQSWNVRKGALDVELKKMQEYGLSSDSWLGKTFAGKAFKKAYHGHKHEKDAITKASDEFGRVMGRLPEYGMSKTILKDSSDYLNNYNEQKQNGDLDFRANDDGTTTLFNPKTGEEIKLGHLVDHHGNIDAEQLAKRMFLAERGLSWENLFEEDMLSIVREANDGILAGALAQSYAKGSWKKIPDKTLKNIIKAHTGNGGKFNFLGESKAGDNVIEQLTEYLMTGPGNLAMQEADVETMQAMIRLAGGVRSDKAFRWGLKGMAKNRAEVYGIARVLEDIESRDPSMLGQFGIEGISRYEIDMVAPEIAKQDGKNYNDLGEDDQKKFREYAVSVISNLDEVARKTLLRDVQVDSTKKVLAQIGSSVAEQGKLSFQNNIFKDALEARIAEQEIAKPTILGADGKLVNGGGVALINEIQRRKATDVSGDAKIAMEAIGEIVNRLTESQERIIGPLTKLAQEKDMLRRSIELGTTMTRDKLLGQHTEIRKRREEEKAEREEEKAERKQERELQRERDRIQKEKNERDAKYQKTSLSELKKIAKEEEERKKREE